MMATDTLLLSRSIVVAMLIAGSLFLSEGLLDAAFQALRKSRDRIRKQFLRRSPVSDKTASAFCEIDMSKMD